MVIVKNISDFIDDNHHIYTQRQGVYKVVLMRNNHIHKRCFTLLKDAIDYRDAMLNLFPTPKSRGRGLGGNTHQWHDMFNISYEETKCYRVILATTKGKIRKSFKHLSDARLWRDDYIRINGVCDINKTTPKYEQSYSDISDKSEVFADSDNIRDKLDNLIFSGWEEASDL